MGYKKLVALLNLSVIISVLANAAGNEVSNVNRNCKKEIDDLDAKINISLTEITKLDKTISAGIANAKSLVSQICYIMAPEAVESQQASNIYYTHNKQNIQNESSKIKTNSKSHSTAHDTSSNFKENDLSKLTIEELQDLQKNDDPDLLNSIINELVRRYKEKESIIGQYFDI